MPAGNHEEDLARLAAAVRGDEQFEAIFDQVRPQGGTLPFKVLRVLDTAQPFLKSFRVARESGFLDALVERLLHAQVFDLAALAVANTAPLNVTPHLQAVTRRDLGFTNIELEIRGKLTASRRLCCITVLKADLTDAQTIGTGFLVGPQIVLTSGHVVQSLVNNLGKPIPGSNQRIRVAFDQTNGLSPGTFVQVQENWLVQHSAVHPLEASRQPLNWDDPPESGFDEHLDFALLRLSRAMGYERGFYTLDPRRMPVVGSVGGSVALLQHPAGRSQSASPGAATRLWPPSFQTRMLHDANSEDGSSGGLLVDSQFLPIGLHQCTYRDAQNRVVCNGAIPTAHIAGLNLPFSHVVGLDPIWKLKDTGEPVIGREDFQFSVIDALDGEARILTVAGSPGLGRSFTIKILRQMLGIAEHQVVELSASKLPVTARDTALSILKATDNEAGGAVLPTTGEADSAQPAWIVQELLPAFARALANIAKQRTVWLVIDDVDRYSMADTSTRLFLESVYASMAGIPNLRIVLIGYQGDVPGAVATQVRAEILREFSLAELTAYIDRESTAREIQRLQGQVQTIALHLLDDVPRKPNGQRQADLAREAAKVARRSA